MHGVHTSNLQVFTSFEGNSCLERCVHGVHTSTLQVCTSFKKHYGWSLAEQQRGRARQWHSCKETRKQLAMIDSSRTARQGRHAIVAAGTNACLFSRAAEEHVLPIAVREGALVALREATKEASCCWDSIRRPVSHRRRG